MHAVSDVYVYICEHRTDDGMGCADVSLEQEVQFNVTVTMEQCPSGGANL